MTRGALLAALLATTGLLPLSGCAPADDDDPPAEGPSLEALVRPDTPGNMLLYRFDAADVVETYGSVGGRFLVHFTRDGTNGVPPADTDASGVPDFVEEVGAVYEEVLTKYHDEMGFLAPVSDMAIADNGGDERFDVYLVDFAGQGDGHYSDDKCGPGNQQVCAGYMVQENDFKGYGYPSTLVANRILGSHEFFHAVQSAYDNGQGSVIVEGSAVWATETFDPTLKDFEGFLPGYLQNPDRPLDKPLPGAVDPFSYGAGIYFEFLAERYGVDTVRTLWERCVNGENGVADPYWLTELDPLLAGQGTTFADAMTEFATWNLFLGKFADPARSYAAGAGYSTVAMEDVTAPYFDDALRVFYASTQYYRMNPEGRGAMTAALIPPDGAPGEIDSLRLLVATRTGSTTAPVQEISDLTAGTETIDTSGADKFIAFVVNTTTEGDSRKPAFLGGGGAGGGGGGGAGGAGGSTATGGTGGSGGEGGTGDPGGCGCRTSRSSDSGFGVALAIMGLVGLSRRRRRAKAGRSVTSPADCQSRRASREP